MSDQRIPVLDGLRGAAITYVMLGHFGPSWLSSAGPFGVAVFFALSGRLMADVLFIESADWKEFVVRRFARLYPALIFFLACMFCLAAILDRQDIIADWWSYPTFTVNIVVLLAKRFPPFDHLWSVSIEVQAYGLLLLIAVFLTGQRRAVALMICAVIGVLNGLALTYFFHQNSFLVYWRPDVGPTTIFAAAFMRLVLRDIRLPSWVGPLAFVAANILMLTTTEPWLALTGNGLLVAFFAAKVEHSSLPTVRFFESPALILLGTISYSLYIWQQLFMYIYESGYPRLGSIVLSLVVAIFSYKCIERPSKNAIILIWRRHFAPGSVLLSHH